MFTLRSYSDRFSRVVPSGAEGWPFPDLAGHPLEGPRLATPCLRLLKRSVSQTPAPHSKIHANIVAASMGLPPKHVVDADLIVHYGYACKSRPSLFLFDTMSGRVSRLPPCNLMVCDVLYRRCFRPTSRQNRRTRLVSGDTDLGRPSASTTDARQPCQSIYVVG